MHMVGTGDASGALKPEEAADRTFAAHEQDSAWLDAFTARLDRLRGAASFRRTIEVWGLSQAAGKWLRRGAPPERAVAIADLSATTDLLVRHLKRDRIPAVVRRPIPALGGESVVALSARGETRTVLAACRDMFRFDRRTPDGRAAVRDLAGRPRLQTHRRTGSGRPPHDDPSRESALVVLHHVPSPPRVGDLRRNGPPIGGGSIA